MRDGERKKKLIFSSSVSLSFFVASFFSFFFCFLVVIRAPPLPLPVRVLHFSLGNCIVFSLLSSPYGMASFCRYTAMLMKNDFSPSFLHREGEAKERRSRTRWMATEEQQDEEEEEEERADEALDAER